MRTCFNHGLERGARMRLMLLLGAVILVLGLAACGGDDGGDDGGDAESGAEETAEETTDEASGESNGELIGVDPEGGVTDYVEYTGGSDGPADTSLPPVKIGWVNNEGGSIPPIGADATNAAEFAVQYINEHLGGVDGHPVELDVCLVQNAEEEGLQCAQQFLNDDAVKVVSYGGVAVGAETINSTIDGKKPIMMAISVAPSDATNPNTYVFGGTAEFTVYGFGTFADEVIEAESAAIIYPEGPGLAEVAEAINRASEAAGIETSLVGFNPERGDLVGALTAAGAQTADVTFLTIAGDACVSAADALDSLGVPNDQVVALPQCAGPDLREGLGGDYRQWYYGNNWTAQSNDPVLPSGERFREILDEYGHGDKITDPWWPGMFAQNTTIVRLMNAAAEIDGGAQQITTETLVEQAENYDGPFPMGPPNINCGKYPHAPASCSDENIFYRYGGDDDWRLATGWLAPPEELQEELGAR